MGGGSRLALLAGAALVFLAAFAGTSGSAASTRPRYGGTLRMIFQKPMPSLESERSSEARGHVLEMLQSLLGGSVNGSVAGSAGPFRRVGWEPPKRAVLEANAEYGGGRPYVDRVEMEFGVDAREALVALGLGRADVVELFPDDVRRVTEAGLRVWASQPVELLALVFADERPGAADARIREALSLAIDRAAIHTVLLRRQGEVAGGLLPRWISGYAYVFPTGVDLARARQLRASAGATLPPMSLGYDAWDAMARQVAERIAVNAKDIGIVMQPTAIPAAGAGKRMDVRVVRVRIRSDAAGPAVSDLVADIWPGKSGGASPKVIWTAQSAYEAERAVLGSFRVVPLAHLPELAGLSHRVKNWMPSIWDGWRLGDVWVQEETK